MIGLRRIGTSLGAMVAAGIGASDLVTVQPIDHPFRRTLNLSPALRDRLGPDRPVADEGPGLSGSSFGVVLGLLGGRGIPEERARLRAGIARYRRHLAARLRVASPDRIGALPSPP